MAAGRAKLLHQETGKIIAIGKPPALLLLCDLYNHNPYLISSPRDISVGNDVLWLFDHSGHRPYIDYQATRLHPENRRRKKPYRWIWNMEHRAEPAEIFFSPEEQWQIENHFQKREYVLIQPHIKSLAPPQKQWPFVYYQDVVDEIGKHIEIIQPVNPRSGGGNLLKGVKVRMTSLREFAVLMSQAKCYIGAEGLPHHVAAAFNTPAVVINGGFSLQLVTGYPYQTWFEVPSKVALGVRDFTETGDAIMKAIEPDKVIVAVKRALREGR